VPARCGRRFTRERSQVRNPPRHHREPRRCAHSAAPAVSRLSLEQLDEVLDAVTGRLALRAVALTTYTPSLDVAGATHAATLHALARIADHCATGTRR
jgi:hypothetical protein